MPKLGVMPEEERLVDLAALEEGQTPLDDEALVQSSQRMRAAQRGEDPHALPDPYAEAEGAGPVEPRFPDRGNGDGSIATISGTSGDGATPALDESLASAAVSEPQAASAAAGQAQLDLPVAAPARPAEPRPPSEPPDLNGLSETAVRERADQGLLNVDTSRKRRDRDVIRENVATFFNMVLFSLIGILVGLGVVDSEGDHFQDAFFVGIIVAANVVVGTFQELRATHKLQQLVAIAAPRATVVRAGEEQSVLASEVVKDDLLRLRAGDQVVADGPIVWDAAEIDESLLTGESASVRRGQGEELRSGSFCTAGSCYYRAEKVGLEAYAIQLSAEARELVRRETPLQLRFRRILRWLLVATAFLGALLLISASVDNRDLAEAIKNTTATISSVVPEGLLLGFTVAFAAGAVRVSRVGAIVQDITAVEALNYLDIICLDKTGTITANRLKLEKVQWAEGAEPLRPWLGAFAAATAEESRTAAAIADGLASTSNGATPLETVPFNSERRWSAARLELGAESRNFVLGAPETLLMHCDNAGPFQEAYQQAASKGLRGVILAEATALPDIESALPPLQARALLTVADELRPQVARAFETMERIEIEPKIISGDNPGTVAALIRQLGIDLKGGLISGDELASLDEDEFSQAVEEHSVFGRIDPQQKSRIIGALKANGHFVAMVGDGANDVRALREADVGVAMESGTATARGVAGIILRNDSFEALVEGSRIAQSVLGNAGQLSKLFITKSFYAFLIIIASEMMDLGFPFLPRHGSLTALFTLGIPAAFITLTTPPPEAGKDFVNNTLRFALPASLALAVAAVFVHLLTDEILGRSIEDSRTLVSTTIGIVGLAYMVEVIGFSGDARQNPMRAALVSFFGLSLLGLFILVLYTPAFRTFFDFRAIDADEWAIIIVAVMAALGGQYVISKYWREIFSWVSGRQDELSATRGRAA